ncbi:hypothetical protein [Candidatus Poriferisodalis sp.]|uniref:hypothetical protein n=1 Tax=Candidatus Poriferisodalis sp. TaxID=3101277 RepID=UPI003B01F7D5
MTETGTSAPIGGPAANRHFRRLGVALAAAITATVIALSLGVGSAAAHHEEGPRDHHDEVISVHHED